MITKIKEFFEDFIYIYFGANLKIQKWYWAKPRNYKYQWRP
jgi:hypothetical protein